MRTTREPEVDGGSYIIPMSLCFVSECLQASVYSYLPQMLAHVSF